MLHMINYLYDRDWVTLQHLSKETGYTERTLREDIKYLNVRLAPINIETSKKTGNRLFIPNNYSIKYIYSMLLSESIEFAILEAVFFNTYESIDELAEALYSSTNVVTKAIKHANSVIKKLNFQIGVSPVALIGDEQKITVFFTSYLMARYDVHLPLEEDLVKEINESTIPMHEKLNITMHPIYRNLLSLQTSIRVYRLKQNSANRYERITSSPNQSAVIEFNERLSILAGLSDSNDFYSDVYRPDGEDPICFSPEDLFSLTKTSPKLKQKIDVFSQLIDTIEKELNITLASKDRIIHNIYIASFSEMTQLPIIENPNESILKYTKETVPYVYLIVSEIAKTFSSMCNINYSSLLRYILSATEDFFTIGCTAQPKLKVGLYGHFNRLTTFSNLRILKSTFEHQFDITLIDVIFKNTPGKIKESYDLIITEVNDLNIKTDCFCIPFDISAKEIATLHEYYFDTLKKMVENR